MNTTPENTLPETVPLKTAFRCLISNALENNSDEMRQYDNADIASHVDAVLNELGVKVPDEMNDEYGRLHEIAHEEFERITGYEVGAYTP